MRQKLLKKAAAAILSAAVIGGGAFFAGAIGGFRTDSSTITASAEEGSAEIKLTAMGYTLYLRGDITRELVRKYYTRSDIDYVYAAEGCVLPSDCSELFKDYKAPVINLSNADTSNVTNMSQMFNNCPNLVSVYMAGTDTSNVTDMSYLFAVCNKLETVNLDGIDTSKVTTMKGMFANCYGLKSLDLSGLNTSKVTDMGSMFIYCENLEIVDITGFDTSNVTNTGSMFYKDQKLETIYATPMFKTDAITSSSYMFGMCDNLVGGNGTAYSYDKVGKAYACVDGVNGAPGYFTYADYDASSETLYLSGDVNWNNIHSFGNCSGVKHVIAKEGTVFPEDCDSLFAYFTAIDMDLSEADTSNVKKMRYMFDYCDKLTSLDLSSFDTSNVVDLGSMFKDCHALINLDISNFDTSNNEIMYRMFYQCNSLTSLDLSSFDTSNTENMEEMFNGCSSLTSLDINNFNTSKVTYMNGIFRNCSSLTSIDLRNFDTSNVTNMAVMFCDCNSLTSLDVSSFDTSKATTMAGMFEGCSSLTSLDVSNFDTSNVTEMDFMFYKCSKLKSLDLRNFDTSKVTNMMNMFCECSSLTSLDVSSFDTSKVWMMYQMFRGCGKLESLDLSSFDTSALSRAEYMFLSCPKLKTIFVSYKWNMQNLEEKDSMFKYCSSLCGGNGTVYNENHTDNEYAVVDKPYQPGYLTYAQPKFVSNSMTLGGAISLNFYVDLSCVPPENRPFTKVEFTVNGRKQTAKFDPNKMNSKKTAYGFTCILNSVSMADDVNATVIYYDNEDDQYTASSVSTAESYLKKFNSSDPAKLWNLIQGINDYGYYMQQYLSKYSAKPWTLGVDHTAMERYYAKPFTYEKNKETYITELKNLNVPKEKSFVKKDLSNISYSLTLDSDTALNITIKPVSSYKGSVTVTLDGKSYTPNKVGNNYVVTIEGISAHKLADKHSLTVKTTNGTSTFKASALSYAYEGISDPLSTEEYNAMCALYNYYKTAKAYKG